MQKNANLNWVREGNLWRNLITGQTLVPIKGGGAPAWDQHAFRYRYDDGTEATATWMYSQSTNGSVDSTIKFRLRIRVDEYNDKVASITTPNLYYNYQSGGWNPITTSSSVIRNVASDYTFTDDALVTTERLGSPFPGTGAFEGTGRLDTDGSTSTSGVSTKNDYMEFEFCLQMVNADVANGATLQIALYDGTSALDAYTSAISITVSKVTATNLVVDDLGQTNTVSKPTLVQVHNINDYDLSETNTVEKVTLTQVHNISVYDLAQSNSIEFITGMTQDFNIVIYDLGQSNGIEKITLTQVHNLNAYDLSQSNLVEKVALSQVYNLAVYDLSQSNSVEKVTISQAASLGVADLSQLNSIEFVTLLRDFPWKDGFESGDISAWDDSIGTPVIDGTAALEGSYGLDLTYNVQDNVGIDWINSTKQIYSVEFLVNYNTLAGASGANIIAVHVFDAGANIGIVQIVYNAAEGMCARVQMRNDSGTYQVGGLNPLQAGTNKVVVSFHYKDVSGYADVWVNGIKGIGVSGVDTGTRFPDEVHFGNNGGAPVFTSGTLYVDSFWIDDNPILNAIELSQSNTVEKITLSTLATLPTRDLSQSNTIEKVTLAQVHNLQAYDLSQSHTIEKISLSGAANLTVYDLSQSNLIEAATLTQVHNVTVYDLFQSNLVLAIALTQVHVLQASDLSQSNIVSKLTLSIQGDLQPKALSQSSLVEKVSLTQQHSLSVANLSQPNLVTVPEVNSESALIVQNLGQANSVEKLSLTQLHNLLVDSLSQGNLIDFVLLTQLHILAVFNLSQSNGIDKLSLSGEGTLGLRNLLQSNFVETASLVQDQFLSVYDIAQTNQVDPASFTQTHNINVHELYQNNNADLVIWGAMLNIFDLNQVNSITNYGEWQEQFEFTVTIARYMYTIVGMQTTNRVPASIDRQSETAEVDL